MMVVIMDDQEGVKMADDDNFIDDSGEDPAEHYGSDGELRSPGDAPQAEEGDDDDEINDLFQMGKKKKKKPCVTSNCHTTTNASVEACEEARLQLNKEEDDLEHAISGICEYKCRWRNSRQLEQMKKNLLCVDQLTLLFHKNASPTS